MENQKIGLGGGCHWCTEGVFVSLWGVLRVEQGWVSSAPPFDAFSEAVIVHFNPMVIAAEDLIEVHLETHAATKTHALREKYRSAVYAFAEADRATFTTILGKLEKAGTERLVTTVLDFVQFKPSLKEHQDYYRTDPNRPFCQRFITPKLNHLRKTKPTLIK